MQTLLDRVRDGKRRGEIEAELAVPPFPAALAYLWQAFNRMASRRGSTGWGPAALSWQDIDAFCRMTGFRFAPWEVEVIEALDTAALESFVIKREG